MKIRLASGNPIKIAAVKEIIPEFAFLKKAELETVAVSSSVSQQPIGLEETVKGAENRSREAFEKDSIAIGIESGILPLQKPFNALSITVCCVFDGKEIHAGISSGYELPTVISKEILENKTELEKALHQHGFTNNPEIGQAEGFVSIVTNKRVSRKDLTKQALLMAFCKLEQQHYF